MLAERVRKVLLLGILWSVAGAGTVYAQTVLTAESCYLDGWAEPLKCYRVPLENDPGEKRLAVMVAPAVNESGREPLYLLAGGPGQAASGLAPLLNTFRKINRERAVVLVDRRGAGRSDAFRCGIEQEMPASLEEFTAALAKCYLSRPDYAEALNSRQTVEDLELVRRFLGHRHIALWGGSWGTRTALLYQQWYPQSLSALVLDAVAPIDTKVFLTAAAVEDALQQLERDCREDAVCSRFGDWRSQLDQLLENWTDEQAATFPDPLTGTPVSAPMRRWMLANAIRSALYDPAAAAQLPYAVRQASLGNFLPLSGITGLFASQADGMAMGLTFSVACAEELNRTGAEEVAADRARSFLASAFYDLFQAGCRVWPVQPKPYDTPEPRDHPVLLISGSADPITPPAYAQEELSYLSRKQHLIVQGGGHINSRLGCIPELIRRFLDAPNDLLDSRCVENIRRPPFMADIFGPELAQEGAGL